MAITQGIDAAWMQNTGMKQDHLEDVGKRMGAE
jgi:hypothetical protein